MLNIDLHTHSIASGHAMSTISELLQAAEANGLHGIAITDHCPGIDNTIWLIQQDKIQNHWERQIKGPDLPYFTTFLSRYEKPATVQVRLFKGIECNILSNTDRATDVPLFLADRFDVIIASLHAMPSLFKIQDQTQITEKMIQAMDESIDVVGHPYHKSCCPDMEQLVKAAVDKGVVLELNNSSFKQGKADWDQAVLMLKIARSERCRISMSSDAHMANEVGDDAEIKELVDAVGFPPELIVNRDLESTETFIAGRKQKRANMN